MSITTIIGEIITLFVMAFALGMDAFSVGLGMGLIKLRLRQIFKIGVTIGVFHAWMPLTGMVIGKFLSDKFGAFASIAGGVLLLMLGIQMILASFKKDDGPLITPIGFGLLIFALSVSLDSFSVGLSLGIFGARTAATILIFGFVSMMLTWAGLLLGRKAKKYIGTYSEVLGGCILFFFGLKLLLPI